MCWVSWDKLTKSKRDGGLGFREIETFNDALLAKQSWRILQKPDCLLAKVLLGKYCKTENFMKVQASNACFHGWRSILCGRDLILLNTCKTIGNGEDTNIWEEPWLSTTTLTRPMGPPEQSTQDVKVADLLCSTTGNWNRELVSHIFPIDAPAILSIRPSRTGAPDIHCWIPTKNGEYTTRTGYYAALDDHHKPLQALPNPPTCDWMGDIWSIHLPPKLRVFLWKIVNGALPLGENLET